MTPEAFGTFLAQQRKKRALTQSQLAEKLHVSTAAVSKWERGLCLSELSKLEDIAAAVGVSLLELMQCAEAESVSAGVETVLVETIALSRSQNRRKSVKRLTALLIAAILALCVYCFPLYRFVSVWPLDYYTSGEIGKLLFIGSRADRDTARLTLAQANAAFADLTTPREQLEEKYGLLRRYATEKERHGSRESHSLHLWSAHFHTFDGYGYVWVEYSNRVWDAAGNEVCGSGKCPSLWIFEQDSSGIWQLCAIKEHP